jgi:RNA polymerase sigma-70 factor (ECF subfamily)
VTEIRRDPHKGAHGLCDSDLDLLQRAKLGDAAAFHELVDRHAAGLYRLACALIGDSSDAEDVMQETFLGAFQRMGSFEGRSSVKTWLVSILNRQAFRHHRRRLRRPALRLQEIAREPVADPDAPAERAPETRLDVSDAMARLSPEYRQVMVLREVEGMSYAEISQALGVPIGTVESRLFRARQELKSYLADYLT